MLEKCTEKAVNDTLQITESLATGIITVFNCAKLSLSFLALGVIS